MVYVLLTLNSLIMIVAPFLIGIWLVRRYEVSWKLFLIGAFGFVLAQAAHIPFNQFVVDPFTADVMESGEGIGRTIFVALLLGLSSGVFEEVTRWIFYRFMKNTRDWEEGTMFGTGWGGIESIVFGLLAATTIVNVYIYQSGLINSLVPADQLAANAEAVADGTRQIQELVDSPPWEFLLGAVERLFSLTIQISLAILVLQAFIRKNIVWLFIAIGWHTLVNAVAVFGVMQKWDILLIELAVGLFAVVSFFIIRHFKPQSDSPDDTDEVGDEFDELS